VKGVKKLLVVLVVLVVLVGAIVLLNDSDVETFEEKYAGADLSVDTEGAVRQGTYTRYLEAHANAAYPKTEAVVDLLSYTAEGEVSVKENYNGVTNALFTGSDAKVTWSVDVPESGFYNVYLEYMNVESRGVDVERALYINGELPFDDAYNMIFSRRWINGSEVRVDNQGNEIRPMQVEIYDIWQKGYCEDSMGYVVDPYCFYFEKGSNEITLESINEPMVLSKLALMPVKEAYSYKDYIADQTAPEAGENGKKYVQIIEGEDSTVRSESSLYAKYDKSAPNTSPYSVTKTILNYIGGESWKKSGQWIEWEFEVPEDGYYNITIKGRQNYDRGSVAARTLTIDGEIPFDEMKEVSFAYGNEWNSMMLADENGEAYKFYLEKGKHDIRLEITLGGIGTIMEQLEDSVYRLNQIYRTILVYTGPSPDTNRDYNIHIVYPEVMEAMELETKRLYKIVDDTVTLTGQKADKIATAQTLAQQMERFLEKPQKITKEFTAFKDNITAIGTAMLNMAESKMDIDYIIVSGTEAELEEENAGFFAKAWHEIKAFVASFIVDYDAVGDVYDEDADDIVKVWVATGRDQGTILKTMIDDTFTPVSGVKVNVEIVAGDAILNAVMAGRGPDVVLSMGADQPVNYALRGSAEDITQFSDWEEVFKHFTPSSYEQYRLEGGIYGVPETQTFNVMFYRTDVLEELNLKVPDTWQELVEMLPTLQGKNLSVGIPSAFGSSASSAASTAVANTGADLSMYFTLLYQNDGNLYDPTGMRVTVNDEAGIKAFEDYAKYFNDYGLPSVFDFVSRFRSGEMPLGIMSYATYNTLMVSAPEIRGLWDFCMVPGTEKVDENGQTYLDRTAMITGSATMMIANDDEHEKALAWEFMKWWASTDTQVRFGREIEALLGASARYATANIDAFSQLAWSADDIAVLREQWLNTQGIMEVPGGYYTGRHITNALRKVVNEKTNPRETMQDYVILINEEIIKKRKEFGLPVIED